MAKTTTDDSLAAIRDAETCAPNFDFDTNAIIDELTKWQSLCSFKVTGAQGDRVDIEFITLPKDMDAFVRNLYAFCPDLVDQGTGCVHEMVEAMEEMGEELSPELAEVVEGIDFSNEDYGLEILKRELQQKKSVQLWWD